MEVVGKEMGTSWKLECMHGGAWGRDKHFEEGIVLMLFMEEGTELAMLPANIGWMRLLGLHFATSVLMCSPPRAACALAALPKYCGFAHIKAENRCNAI